MIEEFNQSASYHRRRRQAIWKNMPERLYVPCSYGMKGKFKEEARLLRVTEAELGLAIVEAVIEHPAALALALANHRRRLADVPPLGLVGADHCDPRPPTSEAA